MRLLATALVWSLIATGAVSSPAAEPTSWTLTCEAEASTTTETPGRIAIVKVTADNASEGPILHWKAPAGSWVTLALRPVTERTWASRLDLGAEDGTHQLQCMFVGGAGGEIMSRTYQVSLPDMMLTQTGEPEIWNQDSKNKLAPPILTAPSVTMPVQAIPATPPEPKTGSSWMLAIMLISVVNLMFAFAAGLAFAVHRRRKSHVDEAVLAEIRQRFQAIGLLGNQFNPPAEVSEPEPEHETVPETAPEPESIGVAEAVATETVLESMNQTISEASAEPAEETTEETPEEGVEIRDAQKEEVETKLDINDLSF